MIVVIRSTVIRIAACAVATLTAHAVLAWAQTTPYTEEQIKKGSAIYAQNCSACHGPRMLDPQGAFDLRTFPRAQKDRFIASVSKGKNQMPPWGDLLNAEDLESLWAYVMTEQKQ